MFKKIVSIIFLLNTILFADKSIYPLPITFDDTGYVPTYIFFSNNKKSWQFSMTNYKDSTIFYANKLWIYHCDNVLTYKQFMSMIENKNSKCYGAFNIFNPKMDAVLNTNNLKILVYKTEKGEKTFIANIFHKNRFLGQLNIIQNDKKSAYSILKSISINKNIKSIDFYIKKASQELNTTNINTLTRYTFSALLINPKDKRIKPLIKNIVKIRDIDTKMINELLDTNPDE